METAATKDDNAVDITAYDRKSILTSSSYTSFSSESGASSEWSFDKEVGSVDGRLSCLDREQAEVGSVDGSLSCLDREQAEVGSVDGSLSCLDREQAEECRPVVQQSDSDLSSANLITDNTNTPAVMYSQYETAVTKDINKLYSPQIEKPIHTGAVSEVKDGSSTDSIDIDYFTL